MKIQVRKGQRFGILEVLSETRVGQRGDRGAVCRCDCGREVEVRLHHLVHGTQISCGCEGRRRRTMGRHGVDSDGRSHLPLYQTHKQMMRRCYVNHHPAFKNYGGRGIRVALQWHDAAVFCAEVEQLLGPRPAGRTLDRIDNDGHYEPANVRWATWTEQAANRRRRFP